MHSLAITSPILGCWLLAQVTVGLPEYSDNNSGLSTDAHAPGLSSSSAAVCQVTATKTVLVTLSSGNQQATDSIPSGASVETTTIFVSPVQSHAETDATVDNASAHEPASSELSLSSGLSSDLSSAVASATSRTKVTFVSTRTVTFTVDSAGDGHPYATSSGLSYAKETTMSANSGDSTSSSDLSYAKETTSANSGVSTSRMPVCITRTTVGPDGRTTLVESIFVTSGSSQTSAAEASTVLGTALPSSSAQVTVSGLPVPSGSAITSGLPVHTTVTVLGTDGVASVLDTTWIIPVPPSSVMYSAGPAHTNMISSGQLISGLSVSAASESQGQPTVTYLSGTTTCITVTVVGSDEKPTVSHLTIIEPTGPSVTAASNLAPPPFVTPLSLTDLASRPAVTSNSAVSTITWKVIGVDGTVSQITQTITAPSDSVVAGIPTLLPPAVSTNGPPLPAAPKSGNVPAYGDGITSNVQNPTTVASLVSGIGSAPPLVTVTSSDNIDATMSGPPAYSLGASLPFTSYESPIGLPTIGNSPLPYDASSSDSDWASSILYGSIPPFPPPATPVVVTPVPETPQSGQPLPNPYPNPLPNPLPTPLPAPLSPAGSRTITTLLTSFWTNVIPEQTTTYVMEFPLTTLATIIIPRGPVFGKRFQRRQNSVETLFPWSNASITTSPFTENTPLISSLSSQLVTPTSSITPMTSSIPSQVLTPIVTPSPPAITIPTLPANTPTTAPEQAPANTCVTGGKIGNTTVNFDNLLPGPLINPAGDLWFSEGFLVAPPTSPSSNFFMASSGSQLVEFVPPALIPNVPFDGTGDKAEIGVGPNEISPCFRFNFYGASLGCAAEGLEKWCEFEFSAYAYNGTLNSESSLSWSETKRVPACPNFPQGPCPLTPIQLDGYADVTSILITVRVGLELRVWWGDDFQIGWTDNSCEASACRSNAVSRRVKREAFTRASRRGVWQWTANGAKKIDDDYVWSTFE